jgi:hypothetical protein
MDCPRCERGQVVEATIEGVEAQVYVCDACDALWTHQAAVGPATWIPVELFLQARGVAGGRAALRRVDPTRTTLPRG